MNKQEEEILAQFNNLMPDLKKWGDFVDKILRTDVSSTFNRESVVKIFPSHRIKDPKSFLFKALYRKKLYKDPLIDIEDKIGTRIVVLKSDDIKKIEVSILNNPKWKAKITKSIVQEIDDKPNVFDYQSVHIVVEPTEDDTTYDNSTKPYLTCEIQVRTLLQHAFAEVSHDSTYKGPYKNDKEILRHLAKAMALMEATDDYFCNIFTLMSSEKRYYSQYLKELIDLYKLFNKDFHKQDLNFFITESILELLEIQEVQLENLTYYIEKQKIKLTQITKPQNGILFQQPVFLLANYYFDNHRTVLREKWPLNEEALKSIYLANNTSYESY
jgi:ppGpp synthetase/RelA/SpoT-type nucleotidyltranferase